MTVHPTNLAPGVDSEIVGALDQFVAIRRDLHRHPELAFEERRTSAVVAEQLARYGYDVTTGVAGTGVVGVLRKGAGTKRLGLRADMDALPIEEATDLEYASASKGVMHACGHDGHTAILLAAAWRLARTDFSGTLTLLFQPAEEVGAGARRLLSEGLFDSFPCDAVFGLHNWPGVPLGQFGFVAGPAMASVDKAEIRIVGKGGHGAAPHETVDPILAASATVLALQSIVARNIDPRDAAVVSVGSIHGGEASNVIPGHVDLKLTIRSFDAAVRDRLEERVRAIAGTVSAGYGAQAEVSYRRGLPPLLNHVAETELVRDVATAAFGVDRIEADFRPRTASEDFAYYLQAVPGSFVFVGNGDGPPLHSPDYDFNDAIIAPAASLWVRLARAFLV
ncbi:M20 aminoacylase family protein [Bosea sp. RCC_152_1]|uniref:M20 aminoacylase family protein n=1 Tax=Bosea sp. RCC_152_1 TaxID=3239228 RepID=UPI003523BBD7